MIKKNKLKIISCNIHIPGSAEYYKDVLSNIRAVCINYDGYDPKNAKQMKELVDDISDMTLKALNKEIIYVKPEKN